MEISEKVAYLKGLAEGMELDTEKKEGKLLAAIIDVLEDIALELEDIQDEQAELADGLDAVSDDLEDVEDIVFEDWDDEDDEYEEDDIDEDSEKAINEVLDAFNKTMTSDVAAQMTALLKKKHLTESGEVDERMS